MVVFYVLLLIYDFFFKTSKEIYQEQYYNVNSVHSQNYIFYYAIIFHRWSHCEGVPRGFANNTQSTTVVYLDIFHFKTCRLFTLCLALIKIFINVTSIVYEK